MNIYLLYKGNTVTHSKESLWCKMATLKFTTDIHKHTLVHLTDLPLKLQLIKKCGEVQQDLAKHLANPVQLYILALFFRH